MRSRLFTVAALVALLMLSATPVAFARPAANGPVTLSILVTYTEMGSHGPFTADAVVCSYGDTVDLETEVILGVDPPFMNPDYRHGATVLRVQKQFTCADNTGTFTLDFIGTYHWDQARNHGEWKVVQGTGDYENLKGHGTFAVRMGENPTLEIWQGHMQLP